MLDVQAPKICASVQYAAQSAFHPCWWNRQAAEARTAREL